MRETLVKTEEFKDSPLGKIPKDWDVKPLSELADVDRGKFTHRPRNDPRFYGGSYPFIQTGDIANSSGGILSTYSQTLNERGITVSREFPVGTIAITIAANIADTAILGIPMFFPDSVVGAVVKKPNSIRYVELCIRRAKQRLDARAPQSAQKNINLEDLRPLLIAVPSPEEQHRIAEVIDTIDSTIAHTSSLIAKLKQMKAGLLHDLLTRGLDENGELRDAIGHPEQFKDSLLGQIPKEWEIETLRGLAVGGISNGFFKKPELVGSGYRLINVLDLYQDFGIDLNLVERVNATEEEHYKYAVQPGDCFFTRSSLNLMGIAHCNILRDLNEPAIFECHLMRVRPNQSKIVPEFLAHWCRSNLAKQFLMARAKQVTMTTISQPDIAPLVVPLPSKPEQERIVEILDAHDSRIRTEEAYRDKLKLQKQGLMHDLLTGKVRVKDVDKFTPASDTV
jgi:type I restriction enzyme S subunit